jgi:hypothetical protein
VNTPRSHLHSFCANGVSSSLATRVALNRVSRGGWEILLIRGVDLLLIPCFTVVRDCCLLNAMLPPTFVCVCVYIYIYVYLIG